MAKPKMWEHFKIKAVRRLYDRDQGKFTFNISYETTAKMTPRSLVVAEAFGLGIDEAPEYANPIFENQEAVDLFRQMFPVTYLQDVKGKPILFFDSYKTANVNLS